MKNITALLKDLRIQVFIFLLLILFWAFLVDPQITYLMYPFIAILLVVVFDLILVFVKKEKIHFPSSSLVTGMLIGLLFSPQTGLGVILLAALLAVISKQFLRKSNRHIFNPAAFGILVSSLITSLPISWWAVSKTNLSYFLILIFGFYILKKFRRLQMVLLFLLFYSIYLLIASAGSIESLKLVLDPTVFLFAFIMLPEPMTSPIQGFWKYSFGILVVIYMWVISFLGILEIDLSLLSLLLANLTAFLFKLSTKKIT